MRYKQERRGQPLPSNIKQDILDDLISGKSVEKTAKDNDVSYGTVWSIKDNHSLFFWNKS